MRKRNLKRINMRNVADVGITCNIRFLVVFDKCLFSQKR